MAAEAEAGRRPLIADREVAGPTRQPKALPSLYPFSSAGLSSSVSSSGASSTTPLVPPASPPPAGCAPGRPQPRGMGVGGQGGRRGQRQRADARRPGRLRLRFPCAELSRSRPRQAVGTGDPAGRSGARRGYGGDGAKPAATTASPDAWRPLPPAGQ